MPGLYARTTKITNALGRARYISDDLRQEEIVLHKKEMVYDWDFYAQYEQEKSQTGQSNNQAREIVIALPNELYEDKPKLEEVCNELTKEILVKNHDYEYAVHWNKSRTNLHMHLLFSERTVNLEVKPKTYQKDMWYKKDTNQLAKAHSENAELRYKKGEVMKDKQGNIRYNEDPLSAKDKRFVEKSF